MRLEWLPMAIADFNEIVDYIAEDNPLAAIDQGNEIDSQVAGLLANRNMGRSDRIKGTRELIIVRTPYIVAYRIVKKDILILRVLHGARCWPDCV